MMVNIIRDIWDSWMGFIVSFSNLMPTSGKKNGVNLPNLPTTWVDLCVKGILVPGHVSHSFLRPTDSPKQSTFDPVASFVSAVNLHRECPPTLLKALADSHPDREIWLESY
jgi:hypothetical protein